MRLLVPECRQKILSPAAGETEFDGVAEWNTGDPLVDIDGDARPKLDATADVAGADVP